MTIGEEYTCELCGETFENTTTEETVEKEFAETFVGFSTEEVNLVCESCFNLVMEHELQVVKHLPQA